MLAAFVGAGLGIGLIVLYYWDQILDLVGIQAMIGVLRSDSRHPSVH